MANSQFDQVLSTRLREGEVDPPPHLWANIELHLERESGAQSKRLVLVYKWAAAACLAMLVSTIGLFYLRSPNNTDSDLASRSTSPAASNSAEPNGSVKGGEQTTAQPVPSAPNNHSPSTVRTRDSRQQSNSVAIIPDKGEQRAEATTSPRLIFSEDQGYRDRPMPVLATVSSPRVVFSDRRPDPLSVLLGRLYDQEKSEQKANAMEHENLWTSVGIAAGTFDPSYGSAGPAANMAYATPGLQGSSGALSSKAPEPGASYAFGVNLGTRIAPHFVLTGGLTYLNQSASFSSSSVGVDATNKTYATLDAIGAGSRQYVYSGYKVRSNFQYLSVPVKAGWQVVQHKVGVQINGGVATDFFMENTLSPDKAGVASVSYTAGDNPVYRPVNFNGLLGAELSYKVGKQYRLALDPGIRVPFGSIYRDGSTSLLPFTLDVGLHFRYIFH